jgi:hypothetical protein
MFVNGHSETIESCKYAIQVQPVAVVSESSANLHTSHTFTLHHPVKACTT